MAPRRQANSELGARLEGFRNRLCRMVQARMHPQLHGRVDASDVVQDAFLEVCCRLSGQHRRGKLPFFLWVRRITADTLFELHRHHLGAKKRDVRRETRVFTAAVSARSFSQALLDKGPTPPDVGMRNELSERLRKALGRLDDRQRETLTLRYFDDLEHQSRALFPLAEFTDKRRVFSRFR